MSGFEVAGIVLGAWPILIEGLKFYAEERGVVKDFNNCQLLVQSIYRQLKREKVTFENSSRCLFIAAAKQSDRILPDVAAMMISPEDPRWMDVNDADPHGLFSLENANYYSEARKDIEEVLHKIQGSLDKVPATEEGKHTTRRQWDRLLFAIKQDQLEVQMAKAEKVNRFLVNMTRDNVMSSISEPTRRSARHYSGIREHAIMMAEALQQKLLGEGCPCRSQHSASLVLEVRPSNKRTRNCHFHVLFATAIAPNPSIQTKWATWEAEIQATESSMPSRAMASLHQIPTPMSRAAPSVKMAVANYSETSVPSVGSNDQSAKTKRSLKFWRHESPRLDGNSVLSKSSLKAVPMIITPVTMASKQTPNVSFEIRENENTETIAEEIQDLCATIAATQMKAAGYSILISREGIWQRISRMTKPCCTSKHIKIVSLAQILSAGLWEMKPRSELGLKLASTVLQLYQTAWLSDDWGKEDILFIEEENGTIVTDKPFIRPKATSQPSTQKSASINMNIPCLFALGVVLVELHYKKSIEELQKEVTGLTVLHEESPEILSLRRTILIWHLIEKMDVGDNLKAVLKRCIKGLDGAWTDINKEELRDMVEEKIIFPLEKEVLWLDQCNKIGHPM